jgi:hypothetical protein
VYLAVDSDLAPVMSDEHRSLLENVAQSVGSDALGRMLGLWLEQESLVRGAGNRELALEVASLRLARWPSVQRVEEWLAGDGAIDGGPSSGPGRAGSPPTGDTPPTSQAGSDTGKGASTKGAETDRGEETKDTAAIDTSLAEEASTDPGVILATRVLGGDVVAVRSDGDGS